MTVCRTCPSVLAATDQRLGCVRCAICRAKVPRVYGRGANVEIVPKAQRDAVTPPSESWWVGKSREELRDAAQTRTFTEPKSVYLRHPGFGDPVV